MIHSLKTLFAKSSPRELLNARQGYHGPALFSYGFRPFFLFGAIWAAFSVPFWMYAYTNGGGLIGGMPAQEWHAHEMLYGYLAAVIAGFLLTAMPNWTGRLPVRGARLFVLFCVWVAGRVAMLFLEQVGSITVAIIDCAFIFLLALMMWREVISGKNIRNIPVCVLTTLLAVSNVGFHIRAASFEFHEHSEHLAIGVIALLIAVIGGRIVPNFTGNWLNRQNKSPFPAQSGLLDRIAIAIAGVALIGWTIDAGSKLVGAIFVIAGVLHAIRLVRWFGWRTCAEPLVLILHVGYAWLPVSFLLLGTSILTPALVAQVAALHALTAGAMGTMTLAVMTRATLGHTGRLLTADAFTIAIYGLVIAGAFLRVLGAIMFVQFYIEVLIISSLVWSGAFALFAMRYGPFLIRPLQ